MQKIINIVSGKGGTGKTLLSAVLADILGNAGKMVLVIDLDIFVRGLTTLLYFQKNESLKVIESDNLSVSDFLIKEFRDDKELSISRYRCFDVLPSVDSVDKILNYRDIMPNSIKKTKDILFFLLSKINLKYDYDYIFLDSRAGYDELVAAAHEVSDFSICVEEDDNISMITSENLIAQLKNDSKKPVLRIKNKVRKHLQEEYNISLGISFIGDIPFDTDVMNSFGTESFWEDINKSMYKEALINVWNSLAKKMDLDIQIKNKRISPLISKKFEKRLSMLSTINRIIFLYGIVITLLSFFIATNGADFLKDILADPIRQLSLFMGIFGVFLISYSIIRNNRK